MYARPSLLRTYSILANITIDSEDLLIIYKPLCPYTRMGAIWAFANAQLGW